MKYLQQYNRMKPTAKKHRGVTLAITLVVWLLGVCSVSLWPASVSAKSFATAPSTRSQHNSPAQYIHDVIYEPINIAVVSSKNTKIKTSPIDGVPDYILKSLFFLPILFLLSITLWYSILALRFLQKLISDASKTRWILATQEAVNDYLAVVTFMADGMAAGVQEDGNKDMKLLKDTTEQLLAANQVSSAKTANITKQINYSIPKILKQRPVYIPLVIALCLTFLLNIILFLLDAIRITPASGAITVGVVLFSGLLMGLAYRYLCYARNLAKRNSDYLAQVEVQYTKRITFFDVAVQKFAALDSDGTLKKYQVQNLNNGTTNIQSVVAKLLKIYTSIKNTGVHSDFSVNTPLFDVSSYVKKIVKDMESTYKSKELTILSKIDGGIVTYISPQDMRQVVESLFVNACEFSLPKGTVQISASRGISKITFTVQDKGVGISGQKLPTLMKPFSGASIETKELYTNPGLNLYMDKIIVQKLGGTIKIASTIGSGTKATVQIPIRRSADQTNPLLPFANKKLLRSS